MSRFACFLLVTICCIPFPVQCQDVTGSAKPKNFSSVDPERIVLIAFSDRHIRRLRGTGTISYYRRRGEYRGSSWSRRMNMQFAEDYSLQLLTDWPMTELGLHCSVFKVPESIDVDQLVQKLNQDDRVEISQPMHTFFTQSADYDDPYFPLQSYGRHARIKEVHSRLTGKSIKIGLVDTGVDLDHPDLIGQISENKNFAVLFSSSFTEDMHGTAVAGVIAAHPNNGIGIVGLAPGSQMLALKACWPTRKGSLASVCNTFTLALAINAAIRSGVDILNLSLSGPNDPLLTLLINKAVQQGIIVVAADREPADSAPNFPASLSNVIAVRSTVTENTQSAEPGTSVAAPGTDVLTTLPNGSYDFVTGNSLATAYISGLLALLRERDPDLSTDSAREILRTKNALNICNLICETTAKTGTYPQNRSLVGL